MEPLPIDVVILSWNDEDFLPAAVASAVAERPANIIVVDNGSDIPVPETGQYRLARSSENLGVARGRNLGVSRGDSEFVCILDSDATFTPGSLQHLLRPMEDPTVGVVVPVFSNQPPTASAGRAPGPIQKLKRIVGRADGYVASAEQRTKTEIAEVDFGIGACQFVRRSVWEQVDGLDESIFFGPEDVDFCLRAKEAGWRVVQNRGATVIHPARRRFRRPVTLAGLRHAKTLVRFYLRHWRRFVLRPKEALQ